MCASDNVISLRGRAAVFFPGQAVTCPDPDISTAQRPILTDGIIHGFDREKGDILVRLRGETGAARRFKPYQLAPGA